MDVQWTYDTLIAKPARRFGRSTTSADGGRSASPAAAEGQASCSRAPTWPLPLPRAQAACACLLALLFRVMSRAADDYFSCILSQAGGECGQSPLPPPLPPSLCTATTSSRRRWRQPQLVLRAPAQRARALAYASPSSFFLPPPADLVQISQDLGLPPRLAGVTLLALGNGAPDISSVIAAVKTGQSQMALGALT